MVFAHGNFAVIPPALWNLGLCLGWPLFIYYQHRTDLKAGGDAKSTSRPLNQAKRLTTGNILAVLGYLAVYLAAFAAMILAMHLTQHHFKPHPWAWSHFSGSFGTIIILITINLGSLLKTNFKDEAPLKLIGLYAGILIIGGLGVYAANFPAIRRQDPIPWDLISGVFVAVFIFSMVVIGKKDSRAEKVE